MNKRPIIIDTDPGIDDAVAIAIALFSGELDVRLLTTVAGNVSLDKVTYNTLRLLQFYGKEVPVAKGADAPLIRPFLDASNVHGASGMEGFDFEEPDDHLLLKENAAEAMRRVILESDRPVTLVPIAPLTNIALLLKTFPEVKGNIDEIVMMGGSAARGNKGVMSEFNVATDPEAAKIVFDAGLPIVMAGLDVGWKALVLPEDSAKLPAMGEVPPPDEIISCLTLLKGFMGPTDPHPATPVQPASSNGSRISLSPAFRSIVYTNRYSAPLLYPILTDTLLTAEALLMFSLRPTASAGAVLKSTAR